MITLPRVILHAHFQKGYSDVILSR